MCAKQQTEFHMLCNVMVLCLSRRKMSLLYKVTHTHNIPIFRNISQSRLMKLVSVETLESFSYHHIRLKPHEVILQSK